MNGTILTEHLTLQGDETLFPALSILLLSTQRSVPVEELEVALQDGPDLHLPLGGAAAVQQVDHGRQAAQGESGQRCVFGLRRDAAAPGPQHREQILHRARRDGEQAIFLEGTKPKRTMRMPLVAVTDTDGFLRCVDEWKR